jgi:hypothetical protein
VLVTVLLRLTIASVVYSALRGRVAQLGRPLAGRSSEGRRTLPWIPVGAASSAISGGNSPRP